jgi:hypothetical protein
VTGAPALGIAAVRGRATMLTGGDSVDDPYPDRKS